MSDYIFVTDNSVKGEKVNYADILYAEATSRHTSLITEEKRYVVYLPLDALQKKLPRRFFRRVHTSYIVSIDRVIAFDLERGFLSLRTRQSDPEGVSIPVQAGFTLNWCRNKCVPGKERGFASLLRDVLLRSKN